MSETDPLGCRREQKCFDHFLGKSGCRCHDVQPAEPLDVRLDELADIMAGEYPPDTISDVREAARIVRAFDIAVSRGCDHCSDSIAEARKVASGDEDRRDLWAVLVEFDNQPADWMLAYKGYLKGGDGSEVWFSSKGHVWIGSVGREDRSIPLDASVVVPDLEG